MFFTFYETINIKDTFLKKLIAIYNGRFSFVAEKKYVDLLYKYFFVEKNKFSDIILKYDNYINHLSEFEENYVKHEFIHKELTYQMFTAHLLNLLRFVSRLFYLLFNSKSIVRIYYILNIIFFINSYNVQEEIINNGALTKNMFLKSCVKEKIKLIDQKILIEFKKKYPFLIFILILFTKIIKRLLNKFMKDFTIVAYIQQNNKISEIYFSGGSLFNDIKCSMENVDYNYSKKQKFTHSLIDKLRIEKIFKNNFHDDLEWSLINLRIHKQMIKNKNFTNYLNTLLNFIGKWLHMDIENDEFTEIKHFYIENICFNNKIKFKDNPTKKQTKFVNFFYLHGN